jgi:hypothetical protein
VIAAEYSCDLAVSSHFPQPLPIRNDDGLLL